MLPQPEKAFHEAQGSCDLLSCHRSLQQLKAEGTACCLMSTLDSCVVNSAADLPHALMASLLCRLPSRSQWPTSRWTLLLRHDSACIVNAEALPRICNLLMILMLMLMPCAMEKPVNSSAS